MKKRLPLLTFDDNIRVKTMKPIAESILKNVILKQTKNKTGNSRTERCWLSNKFWDFLRFA